MTAPSEVRSIDGALLVVPVGLIESHPANVRSALGDLHELAASIRARGVLQPLLVVARPGGRYRLLDGHRRLGAAKLAQRATVPVLLRRDEDADHIAVMLVTTLQRDELTPIEQARAVEHLVDAGLTRAAIAAQVGKSVAWVGDRLALLDLPADAQHLVETRQFTVAEATTLARQVRKSRTGAVRLADRYRPHFNRGHRLSAAARAVCDDQDHPAAGRLAGVACGACWETAIRADVDRNPEEPAP